VTGTPTIFINGKRLQRRDFDSMKRMIDEALAGGVKAAAAGH
jgi:protein-disulfide isomerase